MSNETDKIKPVQGEGEAPSASSLGTSIDHLKGTNWTSSTFNLADGGNVTPQAPAKPADNSTFGVVKSFVGGAAHNLYTMTTGSIGMVLNPRQLIGDVGKLGQAIDQSGGVGNFVDAAGTQWWKSVSTGDASSRASAMGATVMTATTLFVGGKGALGGKTEAAGSRALSEIVQARSSMLSSATQTSGRLLDVAADAGTATLRRAPGVIETSAPKVATVTEVAGVVARRSDDLLSHAETSLRNATASKTGEVLSASEVLAAGMPKSRTVAQNVDNIITGLDDAASIGTRTGQQSGRRILNTAEGTAQSTGRNVARDLPSIGAGEPILGKTTSVAGNGSFAERMAGLGQNADDVVQRGTSGSRVVENFAPARTPSIAQAVEQTWTQSRPQMQTVDKLIGATTGATKNQLTEVKQSLTAIDDVIKAGQTPSVEMLDRARTALRNLSETGAGSHSQAIAQIKQGFLQNMDDVARTMANAPVRPNALLEQTWQRSGSLSRVDDLAQSVSGATKNELTEVKQSLQTIDDAIKAGQTPSKEMLERAKTALNKLDETAAGAQRQAVAEFKHNTLRNLDDVAGHAIQSRTNAAIAETWQQATPQINKVDDLLQSAGGKTRNELTEVKQSLQSIDDTIKNGQTPTREMVERAKTAINKLDETAGGAQRQALSDLKQNVARNLDDVVETAAHNRNHPAVADAWRQAAPQVNKVDELLQSAGGNTKNQLTDVKQSLQAIDDAIKSGQTPSREMLERAQTALGKLDDAGAGAQRQAIAAFKQNVARNLDDIAETATRNVLPSNAAVVNTWQQAVPQVNKVDDLLRSAGGTTKNELAEVKQSLQAIDDAVKAGQNPSREMLERAKTAVSKLDETAAGAQRQAVTELKQTVFRNLDDVAETAARNANHGAVAQSWQQAATQVNKVDDLLRSAGGTTKNELTEVKQSLQVIDDAIKAGQTPSQQMFERARTALGKLDETAAGAQRQAVSEFKQNVLRNLDDVGANATRGTNPTVAQTWRQASPQIAKVDELLQAAGGNTRTELTEVKQSLQAIDDLVKAGQNPSREMLERAKTAVSKLDETAAGTQRQAVNELKQNVLRNLDDVAASAARSTTPANATVAQTWRQAAPRVAKADELLLSVGGKTKNEISEVKQSLQAIDDAIKSGQTPSREMLQRAQTAVSKVDEAAAGASRQAVADFKQNVLRNLDDVAESAARNSNHPSVAQTWRQAAPQVAKVDELLVSAGGRTKNELSEVKQSLQAIDDAVKAGQTPSKEMLERAKTALNKLDETAAGTQRQAVSELKQNVLRNLDDVAENAARNTVPANATVAQTWRQAAPQVAKVDELLASSGGRTRNELSEVKQSLQAIDDAVKAGQNPSKEMLERAQTAVSKLDETAAGAQRQAVSEFKQNVLRNLDDVAENAARNSNQPAVAQTWRQAAPQMAKVDELLQTAGGRTKNELTEIKQSLQAIDDAVKTGQTPSREMLERARTAAGRLDDTAAGAQRQAVAELKQNVLRNLDDVAETAARNTVPANATVAQTWRQAAPQVAKVDELLQTAGGRTKNELTEVKQSLQAIDDAVKSGQRPSREMLERATKAVSKLDETAAGAQRQAVAELKQNVLRNLDDVAENAARNANQPAVAQAWRQAAPQVSKVDELLQTAGGRTKNELTEVKQSLQAIDDTVRAGQTPSKEMLERARTALGKLDDTAAGAQRQAVSELKQNVLRNLDDVAESAARNTVPTNATVAQTWRQAAPQVAKVDELLQTAGGKTKNELTEVKQSLQAIDDAVRAGQTPSKEMLERATTAVSKLDETAAGAQRQAVADLKQNVLRNLDDVAENAARNANQPAVSQAWRQAAPQVSKVDELLQTAGGRTRNELTEVKQSLQAIDDTVRAGQTPSKEMLERARTAAGKLDDVAAGTQRQALAELKQNVLRNLDDVAETAARNTTPANASVSQVWRQAAPQVAKVDELLQSAGGRTRNELTEVKQSLQAVDDAIKAGQTPSKEVLERARTAISKLDDTAAGAQRQAVNEFKQNILRNLDDVAENAGRNINQPAVAQSWKQAAPQLNKVDELVQATTGKTRSELTEVKQSLQAIDDAVRSGQTPSREMFDRAKSALNKLDDAGAGAHQQAVAAFKQGALRNIDDVAEAAARNTMPRNLVVEQAWQTAAPKLNKVNDLLENKNVQGTVRTQLQEVQNTFKAIDDHIRAGNAPSKELLEKAQTALRNVDESAAGAARKAVAEFKTAALRNLDDALIRTENTAMRGQTTALADKVTTFIKSAEREAVVAKQSDEFVRNYRQIQEQIADRSRTAILGSGEEAQKAVRDVEQLIKEHNKLVRTLDAADATILNIERRAYLDGLRSGQTAHRYAEALEAQQALLQKVAQASGSGGVQTNNIYLLSDRLISARTPASVRELTRALDEQIAQLAVSVGGDKGLAEALQALKTTAGDLHTSQVASRWGGGLLDRVPGLVNGSTPTWLERIATWGPVDYVRGMSTQDKVFTTLGVMQLANQYQNLVKLAEQQLAQSSGKDQPELRQSAPQDMRPSTPERTESPGPGAQPGQDRSLMPPPPGEGTGQPKGEEQPTAPTPRDAAPMPIPASTPDAVAPAATPPGGPSVPERRSPAMDAQSGRSAANNYLSSQDAYLNTYNGSIMINNKLQRGGLMLEFPNYARGFVTPPPAEQVRPMQPIVQRTSFKPEGSVEQALDRITNRTFDWRRTQLDPAQIKRADSMYLSNQLLTPEAKRTARMLSNKDDYQTSQSLASKHLQFAVAGVDGSGRGANAVRPGAENTEKLNPDRAGSGAASSTMVAQIMPGNQDPGNNATTVAKTQLNDPTVNDPNGYAQNNDDENQKSDLSLTSLA